MIAAIILVLLVCLIGFKGYALDENLERILYVQEERKESEQYQIEQFRRGEESMQEPPSEGFPTLPVEDLDDEDDEDDEDFVLEDGLDILGDLLKKSKINDSKTVEKDALDILNKVYKG